MKKVVYCLDICGWFVYDWFDSYYSFSFDEYYNFEWVYFGVLRVLNDDWVVLGEGF